MPETDKAVVTEGLVKVYAGKGAHPVRALDGLSLQVNRGEIFGLLGPNGAGKTTLLRILTTLIPPTSGSASVLGFDVGKNPLEVRKRLCVVLQEYAAEIYLSVEDNLATYARFHAVPPREIQPRIDRAMEQFGLGSHRRQKVIDLSGGLKRRVQVAKVFMVDKPIAFLDEPTTGMDTINKRTTLDALRDQARGGRTVFLTTHILQEAEELCDTIAIINNGTCVASGDLQKIKSLAPPAFTITITFDTLDDDLVRQLHALPLLNISTKRNTVKMCMKGESADALKLITTLSATGKVRNFEVAGATLEDAFLELLGPQAGTITTEEGNDA